MSYRSEFRDFDPATMPALPEGGDDLSWHNDTCPNFWFPASRLIVFIDYADISLREVAEGPRFHAYQTAVGEPDKDDEPVLATDDWAEVAALIEARRMTPAEEIEALADRRDLLQATLAHGEPRDCIGVPEQIRFIEDRIEMLGEEVAS